MERYYSYAGVNICIQGPDDYMYKNDRMLAAFRVEHLDDPDIFRFEVVEKLQEASGTLIAHEASFMEYDDHGHIIRYIGSVGRGWANAYMRVENIGKEHYVTIKKSSLGSVIPVHTVYHVLQSERLMAKQNAVIVHASYIECDGKAILFTAPSGTGKSTQADLWKTLRGARILNGDRAAVQDREGIIYACGVPFAGSSNICENVTLPLAAIVYLGQAEHTAIRSLKGFEAFRSIYEGCGIRPWDKEHVEFVSDFIQKLMEQVPVFKLECTSDESAVIALEEALGKKV